MRSIPLLALFLLLSSFLIAQGPRTPQRLDNSTQVYGPAVASGGEVSAVAWKDSSTNEIFVSSSDGTGRSWSAPVRVDDDATGANKWVYDYSIAVDSGNIYLAWRDERNGSQDDCYFSVSSDGGATWSANVRMDDGYGIGAEAVDQARICADSGNVYIGMRVDNSGTGEGIWLASSNDGGASWNASLRADTAASGDCDDFGIACTGGNVYVAFANNRNSSSYDDLFYNMSHNGGISWMATETQIDPSGPGVGDLAPGEISLVVDASGDACIAWLEEDLSNGTSDELHAMFSTDGGHNWGAEIVLQNTVDVDNQFVALSGSSAVIVWEDDRLGGDEVYAWSTSDGGATGNEIQMSVAGGSYPVVVGGGDYWAVIWGEGGYPEMTAMSSSRDGGSTWSAIQDLDAGVATGDTDYNEVAYNAQYGNFIGAWLDDVAGSNNCYAGGLRPASISAVSGSFTPGDFIHFSASGFGVSDTGFNFAVMISSGAGNYALPFGDARNTGLLNNPYLPKFISLLSGTVDASGAGDTITGVVRIPGVPPGTTFYCSAVAFSQAGGISFGSLTDVSSFTVQ